MLITFRDEEGSIHHTYAPWGQTVNHHFHLEVLKCPHDVTAIMTSLTHEKFITTKHQCNQPKLDPTF